MLRVLLAIVVGLAVTPAWGQATEPKPKFPVHDIKLEPRTDWFPTGKAAVLRGKVDEEGLGFVLSGTMMMQPIAVTVVGYGGEAPLKVTIGKTWTEADRTGDTSDNGVLVQKYRTDDVSNIHIAAGKGESFYDLIVWVGDERTDYPDMPSSIDFGAKELAQKGATNNKAPTNSAPGSATPTTAPAAAAAPTTSGTSPVLWIIAGLLGALVVLVGIVVLRRKK